MCFARYIPEISLPGVISRVALVLVLAAFGACVHELDMTLTVRTRADDQQPLEPEAKRQQHGPDRNLGGRLGQQ